MHEIYLCKLCESSASHINLYSTNFIVSHVKTLEHINKNRIKRPVLANSHNFVTHIEMSHYGTGVETIGRGWELNKRESQGSVHISVCFSLLGIINYTTKIFRFAGEGHHQATLHRKSH